MPRKTKKTKGSILVIDDEKDILQTLRDSLETEGYTVYTADEGEKGRLCAQSLSPDLIFLDIWLPHIDGLELLAAIKKERPDTPVVMMSGHAGIETAVRATKLGASDFLEKPFNFTQILSLIEAYVRKNDAQKKATKKRGETALPPHEIPEETEQRRMQLRRKRVAQRTIGKSVIVSGHGLMSGRRLAMQLLPAPPHSGIVFIDINTNKEILLHPNNLLHTEGTGRNLANSTALTNGKAVVRTTEHFLATLFAYGITNLIVKVDEEIPSSDGSALDFCRKINEAGVVLQQEKIDEIVIETPLTFGTVNENEQYMTFEPYDGFAITLRIEFDEPIGAQTYAFTLRNAKAFEEEIAPARTFNTLDNIDKAQRSGKVGSGMISSHIIISEKKVINTDLRFPDEFVRHKILDVIGDVYLLARPIRARITANRTSHSFNQMVVRELAKRFGV